MIHRLLFIVLILASTGSASAKGVLEVSFLDVGQGDAIYIEAPNGSQVMIDGGGFGTLMPALSKVVPFADTDINVLVITNPDADHFAGFIDLLGAYKVGAIIEPGTEATSVTYKQFRSKVREYDVPVLLARKGMTLTLDTDIVLEVIFPDRDVSGWHRNDGSLVSKLTYGDAEFLFMGDGTKITEAIVLHSGVDITSDVLKVGHHGSKTSTGEVFVGTVQPLHAVISRGVDNTYGHPHKEVIDALKKFSVVVHDTAEEGTITFYTDGVHIWEK